MEKNIFKIISRADKEMMQTAMLGHLIQNFPEFRDFFGIKDDLLLIEFEKTISVKKRNSRKLTNIKVDIFIETHNNQYVIENKFKSFPNIVQLTTYDKVLKKKFNNVVKILVSFEKDNSIKTDWKHITYNEIYRLLSEINLKEYYYLVDYKIYLEELLEKYNQIKKNFKNIEDPFFQKLFYYFIGNFLDQFSNFEVKSGRKHPFIDLHPHNWNEAFTIQIQDNKIKFYCYNISLLNDSIIQKINKIKTDSKNFALINKLGSQKSQFLMQYDFKISTPKTLVSEINKFYKFIEENFQFQKKI